MKRVVAASLLAVVLASLAYVIFSAVDTLQTLTAVERERDTWQRPDDVLRHLNLVAGSRVVDLGSGAGYFALKMARRVGPGGRVLAVDLRRESLTFLWIRARRDGLRQLQVVHGDANDPRLPPGEVDAVLIANTFHELSAPAAILDALSARMRPGATLVVVDRGPRGAEPESLVAGHHEIPPSAAERIIAARGFVIVTRDIRFIDRPGDSIWWLLVFRKP